MPPAMFPEGMGPPDGGYGWVIAVAYSLNNIIMIPILQNFGLVFRDLFKELNISGIDTAVIMNVNNAFGLALGLFNGPILRTFSYRKVAIVGSLLVFTGMVLTSFARSFIEFLVFYGLIMSAGYNLTMASFAYAINTYFTTRRGVAMGFAMTVTGLGPVFMPLLISLSMREYGARSTALLLAALALHSTVGALLLQPVRWHLVKKETKKDDAKEMVELPPKSDGGGLEALVEEPEGEKEDVRRFRNGNGHLGDDHDDDTKAPMLGRRRLSSLSGLSHRSGLVGLSRTTSTDQPGRLESSMWASMASIDSEALGGSVVALNGRMQDAVEDVRKTNGTSKAAVNDAAKADKDALKAEEGPTWRRWVRAVVRFFDLDLLRDPIYVNIMLGLSFAVFAEINFSLMTPFILGDRNFNTQEIATFVSIIAVSDIVFRFLAPFIKRACKQPVRVMYLIGLLMLVATRTVLIFSSSHGALIGVMVGLGVAKGLRTVYWLLVLPEYVPIERLPSANGLQSVTNGLIFMALGPLVGVIRDRLGDYNYVIAAFNMMTTLTMIMWSTEFAIVAIRRKRRGDGNADVDVEQTGKS